MAGHLLQCRYVMILLTSSIIVGIVARSFSFSSLFTTAAPPWTWFPHQGKSCAVLACRRAEITKDNLITDPQLHEIHEHLWIGCTGVPSDVNCLVRMAKDIAVSHEHKRGYKIRRRLLARYRRRSISFNDYGGGVVYCWINKIVLLNFECVVYAQTSRR